MLPSGSLQTNARWRGKPWGAPQFIAIAATVGLHLWRRNSMVSIFGGTVLFMLLSRIF